MNTRHIFNTVLLAAFLSLSGCGGSSGDGTDPGGTAPVADATPDAFTFSPAVFADAYAGQHIYTSAAVSGFEGELVASITARACSRSILNTCPRTELSKNGENTFGDTVTLAAGDTLDVHMVINSDAIALETFEATVTVGDIETGASATIKASIPDKGAPTLAVHFPPPFSLSDQAEIRLRGEVSDDGEIVGLEAAGIDATIDEASGVWTATVPLAAGANAIEVVATDAAGKVTKSTVSVDTTAGTIGSGDTGFQPQSMIFDPAGNKLYAAVYSSSVYSFDPAMGVRTEFSSTTSGAGMAIGQARGIVKYGDFETVFVSDQNGAIFAVGMASGDRVAISDNTGTGTGPLLSAPYGVVFAGDADRLFVLQNTSNRLFEIDVITGDRTDIGEVPAAATDIAASADGSAVYVADYGTPALLRIDTSDGSSSDVSGTSGPAFDDVREPELLSDESLYFLVDGAAPALFHLDLASGARTIVSGDGNGNGPAFPAVGSLALDAERKLAYVYDIDLNAQLFAVDLTNGDRVIISKE